MRATARSPNEARADQLTQRIADRYLSLFQAFAARMQTLTQTQDV
ncbi:hypothetical protein [Halochromatium glycolicum]|nr:hypothetical protein [Halochromatium glycolicum]